MFNTSFVRPFFSDSFLALTGYIFFLFSLGSGAALSFETGAVLV